MSARRNVFLLASCQALLLTNAVTLVAVGALAGYALAPDKTLSTLPATTYVLGGACAAFPASMYMKRVGRRVGFLTGGLIGITGALLATFAVAQASFLLLCVGHFLLGCYNGFGQYFRFAAADAAAPHFKAKAISLVMAGGLLGGIVGPELTKLTIDAASTTYLATYASLIVYTSAAMGIVSFLSIPAAVEAGSHAPARSLAAVAAQPKFMVAVMVAALGYAVMNFLMTATPLAMRFCGHPYGASAGVITAHVTAMFAPSFVTGSLIKRFGVLAIMGTGVAIMVACIAVALSGQLVMNFWWALVLLGLGWNFMYLGGSTLLTESYAPAEKAKAQGLNEITIFAVQAISSFSSGVLVNAAGWNALNYVALPLIAAAGAAILWLRARPRG